MDRNHFTSFVQRNKGRYFISSLIIVCLLLILIFGSILPRQTVWAADPTPTVQINQAPVISESISGRDTLPQPQKDDDIVLYLPLVHQGEAESPFLDVQNRAKVIEYFTQNYLNAAQPAMNWSGSLANCVPGTLSSSYQAAVLARINFYRRMAGIPAAVTFLDAYNAKAQAAALMMSRNGALNHTPPTSWICYTQLGYNGASSSNLAGGAYGWVAIDLYMKDPGDNNGAAGHRRWILYPQTQNMGSGDIPPQSGYMSANALVVFDTHYSDPRPTSRQPFVAWPPAGYVPYQLVHGRWSFSYDDADFSSATVSVKYQGSSVPVTLEEVHNGYGENTLVWQVNNYTSWTTWSRPSADARYMVSVRNVKINSVSTDFNYDVIIIDAGS